MPAAAFEHGVDDIVANHEVAHIGLQALLRDVLWKDHIYLNVFMVLLDVPGDSYVRVSEPLCALLTILQVLLALRVDSILVGHVVQK